MEPMQVDPSRQRLRVGRKIGRTVYVHERNDPDTGILIGVMDTPELAAMIVEATNRYLDHLESTE